MPCKVCRLTLLTALTLLIEYKYSYSRSGLRFAERLYDKREYIIGSMINSKFGLFQIQGNATGRNATVLYYPPFCVAAKAL